VPGALTATGGMLALVYGLSNASSHSWTSTSTIVSLAVSVVLLASFAFVERRSKEPLMPFSIFKNRNRTASYGLMLCIGIALFSMFYFLTQYLQNVLGYSPIRTGVGFLPMTSRREPLRSLWGDSVSVCHSSWDQPRERWEFSG